MVEESSKNDDENQTQDLSIQQACKEYIDSVKVTLNFLNDRLNEALVLNYNGIEELCHKIQARVRFLECNPSFLSSLTYFKSEIKNEPLREFDEIKITIKEQTRRIFEKVEETERVHQQLFKLVLKDGRDNDPTIKPTYDRVIIRPFRHFSDNCLDTVNVPETPIKFTNIPDLPSDVQRGKPLEDLHGKLVQQITASDSLEGFIKLMDRKPINLPRKTTSSKSRKTNVSMAKLEQKYEGSLYFFPQKTAKRKRSKSSVSCTDKVARSSSKVPSRTTTVSSTCRNLLVSVSSQSPFMTNEERTRRIQEELGRTKLKCYDILDDLSGKDLKPIKSEYPRRDNILLRKPIKPKTAAIEQPYLKRMLKENDKVWKKFFSLPLPVQSPVKRMKNNSIKNLIEYLTAPDQKTLQPPPQNVVVMPVKVYYDNYPTKEVSPKPNKTDLSRENSTINKVFVTDLTKSPKKVIVPEQKRKTSPLPLQRKKVVMLEHLRGLKARNDNIQKNIQKAINVIETKMIDLLSASNDSGSSDAFNAMEKEITKVLKMMNDGEASGSKKVEKVEAEKDENHPKVGKLKRGLTMVRTNIVSDFVAGVDLPFPKQEEVKTPAILPPTPDDDKKIPMKQDDETNSPKNIVKMAEIPLAKRAIVQDVPKRTDGTVKMIEAPLTKKTVKSDKKVADIEEGEKILGQVDSVIRKIDSIYTKFSNTNSERKLKAFDNETFKNPQEFFDGLKNIVELPPVVVQYKKYENIAQRFQIPKIYCQPKVYHQVRIEESPKLIDEKGDCDVNDMVVFCQEEWRITESRHEVVLKTFYSIFFSSILVALNFDYTS